MKELFRPWNDWDSFDSQANYLKPDNPNAWPVFIDARLSRLTGAETFGGEILTAIHCFNPRRIEAVTSNNDGVVSVTDGKRLLRPLFETTELNLISSKATTHLHPFSDITNLPVSTIEIRDSFFLNSKLIEGGGFAQYTGL